MATKRLTLEEAKEALRHPLHGFVWALNYDPNGIPGDWDGMTDMVEPDDLDDQYGPFVLTTEGEAEAIDTTVLTLMEQIRYEADRVENAEDLEIDEDAARAHLRSLLDAAWKQGIEDPDSVEVEVLDNTEEKFFSGPDNDGVYAGEMGDEPSPKTPTEAVDRLALFVDIFDDHDPSLDAAIHLLNEFVRSGPDLEWGEPGDCPGNGLGGEPGTEDGRHYGLPHCSACLQGT